MKAPDKVYLCIPQRLNMSTFKEDSKYVGMAYSDRGNLTSPQIEEYIRKDALMEIINVEKTRHTERRSIEGIAACHALNDLIKQLELYDIK